MRGMEDKAILVALRDVRLDYRVKRVTRWHELPVGVDDDPANHHERLVRLARQTRFIEIDESQEPESLKRCASKGAQASGHDPQPFRRESWVRQLSYRAKKHVDKSVNTWRPPWSGARR